MKKTLLLLPFILASCFGTPSTSFAITYGGGNSIDYPAIQSSTGNIATITNGYSHLGYYLGSPNERFYTLMGCTTILDNQSGSLFETRLQGSAVGAGGLVTWGDIYFYISPTGSNNDSNIVLHTRSFGSNVVSDLEQIIMTVPTIINSGTPNKSQGVVCVSPRVVIESDSSVYLYDIKFSYYKGSTGVFGYGYKNYTSSSILGRKIFNGGTYFGVMYQPEIKSLESNTGTTWNLVPFQEVTGSRVEEFFSSTGGNNLPQWFNALQASTGGVYELPGSGGGGSGSGRLDFSGCDTFGIGCYISNISDYVYNTFFPNINFTGDFNSCSSGSNSQDSVMQKIANVISIVNPYPPPTGTSVCSIFGDYIIEYQRLIPEQNFFEVYAPGMFPALENDGRIIFGQTIPDIIVIFSMFSLILYHIKND